jgi:hypothetical protein
MNEAKIEVSDLINAFKEQIADQSEQIAMLKATIAFMARVADEKITKKD